MPKKKYAQGPRPKDPEKKLQRIKKIIKDIATAVENGMNYTAAARAAGVNPRTYYYWKESAEGGEEPFASLWPQIENARSRGLAKCAKRVMDAGTQDWRAAAWMLERRDPKNFGKREHQTVEHSGQVNTEVSIAEMSTKERLARIAELEKKIKEMERDDAENGKGPGDGSDQSQDDRDSPRSEADS